MNRRVAVGAGAMGGLIGGVVFDVLMRWLPEAGRKVSMIAFAAGTAHVSSPLGWLVYPVYGVIIGALFGLLLQGRMLDEVPAMVWGGVYGVAWWIVAQIVVIPLLDATVPLSSAAIDLVRNVSLPLLAGHVVYGVILGLTWSTIVNRRSRPQHPRAADYASRRAA